MRKTEKKVQVSCQIPEDVNKLFQSKYPYTMNVYLRHCIYAAINSKEVFQRIFFDVKECVNLNSEV